jgi:polysaccharide chain length determinant protein (PEP-CTERM system associated)
MLPGKKYKPEDLLLILRRRFWMLLVPFAIVAAGTAVVARKLPDWYRSQALILVVPPQVPATYVTPNASTRLEDRLQAINQKILSRTTLENMIQQFNLYPDERRTGIMEDVVEKMRSDIHVDPIKGAEAFTVAYEGSSARTVQKVADKIASLYIDESLRDRQTLSESTNQFIEAQLEDARRRLQQQEKLVQDYRMKFSGQLPSQAQSNLQSLQNTQMELRATLEAISHDREQRLFVDRQLADLQAPPPTDAAPVSTGSATADPSGPQAGGTTAQRLDAMKAYRAALLLRYTSAWPEVQRAERLIGDLEKQLNTEALQRPVSAEETVAAVAASPVELARRRRVKELKDQGDQIDRQIANAQAEAKRLQGVAADYQQRVDVVPERESEMAELTRDYGTLTSVYTGLLAKKEESQIAANLERGEIGEQFKLLDPARTPEKPISPDRPRINIVGMIAGLAIGLALIGLLEYRDTTFKTDDEITSLLAVPVLAVVPLMQSDLDRRQALRRRLIVGCGLGGTVLGCLAILVYTFVR